MGKSKTKPGRDASFFKMESQKKRLITKGDSKTLGWYVAESSEKTRGKGNGGEGKGREGRGR